MGDLCKRQENADLVATWNPSRKGDCFNEAAAFQLAVDVGRVKKLRLINTTKVA